MLARSGETGGPGRRSPKGRLGTTRRMLEGEGSCPGVVTAAGFGGRGGLLETLILAAELRIDQSQGLAAEVEMAIVGILEGISMPFEGSRGSNLGMEVGVQEHRLVWGRDTDKLKVDSLELGISATFHEFHRVGLLQRNKLVESQHHMEELDRVVVASLLCDL